MEILLGFIAGIKLAVFVTVLVYSYLSDIPIRKKGFYWLNIMAAYFIVMTLVEFAHIISTASGVQLPPTWLYSEDSLNVFIAIFSSLAGLAIILFLNHLRENLKYYK